jgi:hypothetical protein
MGGFGSGRWGCHSKATTVEDCRRLDANRWMREGILRANQQQLGRWCWYRDESLAEETSSIVYDVHTSAEDGRVRLMYTVTKTQESFDYAIRLTTTRPRFGGLRWWFVCPLIIQDRPCQRRVAKLYLPPGGKYYGCRHCYQLTYTSCQESGKDDALARILAKSSGLPFEELRRNLKLLGKGPR